MSRRRGRRAETAVQACRLEDLIPPHWTKRQRSELQAALPRAKTEVKVVVTGVTGSGKSALINALCGTVPKENVEYDEEGKVIESELPAKEGEQLSHETQQVASYVAQKASLSDRLYTITVWDSPGLEDGTGGGLTYLEQLRKDCGGDIDILLYCVNVSIMKSVVDDMVQGITLVTQTLGADIWQHALIVLTFANMLENNIKEEALFDEKAGEDTNHVFASRLDNWKHKIRSALVQGGVPETIASGVLMEPAGDYLQPSLPDRPHWLGYLWLQFLCCVRDEAKLAILITNQHRIRDAEHLTPTDLLQQQEAEGSTHEIPIVVNSDQVSNAVKIGASVGAGVASVTGACVGAAAGGVLLGALTAGVGAGVGLATGAAVGAVIGPLLGVAVSKTLQKRQEKSQRSASIS